MNTTLKVNTNKITDPPREVNPTPEQSHYASLPVVSREDPSPKREQSSDAPLGAASLSNTVCKSNDGAGVEAIARGIRTYAEIKKRRYLMRVEIREQIRKSAGMHHWVFLTFTTPDNCTDKAEFERRINNLLTGRLRKMCGGRYIMVRERQKRGAWHIHVMAHAGEDVRLGTKWGMVYNKYLRKKVLAVVRPGRHLKPYWELCRIVRQNYDGLNRCSAEPAGKNGNDQEVLSRYLCKYITKEKAEHGKRLLSFGRNWVRATSGRVMMLTDHSARWRAACEAKYRTMNQVHGFECPKGVVWQVILRELKELRAEGRALREALGEWMNKALSLVPIHDGDMFGAEQWQADLERLGLSGCLAARGYYVPVPFMVQHPDTGEWLHLANRDGVPPRDHPYDGVSPPSG